MLLVQVRNIADAKAQRDSRSLSGLALDLQVAADAPRPLMHDGEAQVLAGVAAHRWGGSWPDGLLVAVTERNTAADMEALLDALGRIS